LEACHDALNKALVLRQIVSASCFDAEDRALANAHIYQSLETLLGALRDSRDCTLQLDERMRLLNFASAQGILPTSSRIFAALVRKQSRLAKHSVLE